MILGGSNPVSAPARLILVGVRGFGQVHAERIARLADQGLVELVAAVDPGVALDPPVIYGANLYADLAEALAAVGPVDVVVAAAPLGAHFALARTALTAGADVYLEKPPVTSLDQFTRLLELERQTGRVMQVGFQSLGSHALELLGSDAFDIGPLVRVGAVGAWSRTVGYWSRSPWSGRRNLHGRAVVDGVVTNALAHAVVTALAVPRLRRGGGLHRGSPWRDRGPRPGRAVARLVGRLRRGTGPERARHGRDRGIRSGSSRRALVRPRGRLPGIGSALAWDRPVSLAPGEVLARRFDIAVADGRLSEAQVAALAGELLTGALRQAQGASQEHAR